MKAKGIKVQTFQTRLAMVLCRLFVASRVFGRDRSAGGVT